MEQKIEIFKIEKELTTQSEREGEKWRNFSRFWDDKGGR